MDTAIKAIFRQPETYLNQTITVKGWIRTIRTSKNFGFIEINDGGFFKNLQVAFEDTLENFEEIAKLGVSTALIVQGTLVESIGAKQPFELKAT